MHRIYRKIFLIQAKRSYQKASLSLLPRISEEYCVQLYLYFIIQSAVKFSKNRKYCLCRLFYERKWCRSLKQCYSTAILLSIVKYNNEWNVIKKGRIWQIKCSFEKVGAKKQRKSIRKKQIQGGLWWRKQFWKFCSRQKYGWTQTNLKTANNNRFSLVL